MKIDKETTRKLKEERKSRFKETVESLLKGDPAKARENLDWLQSTKQLLDERKNRQKYYWAIAVGLVCIFLVGLSFKLTVNRTNVSLDVLVDGVMVTLEDRWQSDNVFYADFYSIDYLTHISSSLIPDLRESLEPFDMILDGEKIRLTNLSVDKNAEIELETDGEQLAMYVKNTTLSGTFSIRRGKVFIDNEQQFVESNLNRPPSDYSFRTSSIEKTSYPCRLEMNRNVKMELTGMPVSAIQFLVEHPPGSGIFQSTIKEGEVYVPETRTQYKLRENDRLDLRIDERRRLAITKEDENIRINFEGKVSRLKAGMEGIEENLMPSCFEYIYNNKRLAFFWSAIVFVIGILWSIRNTLYRK